MIKKFEEFIKESFWKSGINRAKENTVRQEEKDSFFYKDGMFPIKGFHNWFLKFVHVNKIFKRVHVYLKPDEIEMASYLDVVRKGKNQPFKIRDASTCVYTTTDGKITNEIMEILTSDEFIDAINDTLAEMPEKYFSMNESLWKSGINRAKTGEERIEDKKTKVQLNWGPTIYLKDTSWNYENFLSKIVDFGDPYFEFNELKSFNLDEQKNITSGKLDYHHYIDIDGEAYVISFLSYSEMNEDDSFDDLIGEAPCEEDYIAVIKGLVEKLSREVLHFAVGNFSMIQLIDEETLDEINDRYDDEYDFETDFDKYKKALSNHIGWKPYEGAELWDGIVCIDLKSIFLDDLDKVKEFTKKWWKI